MSEKGLGRGLDALLPEEDPPADAELLQLPVDRIEPDEDQPRDRFDEERLAELTRSIESQGVVEPILVRPPVEPGGSYRLVAGERRWRAGCQAGLESIPALVRDIGEDQAYAISLVENVQRENLTPVEEARAYRTLMDRRGWSQEQTAERVGKSRSAIANRIRLLNLPPSVLELLHEGKLTAGHARALLGLEEPERIETLCEEILREDLSVRAVERRVKAAQSEPQDTTPPEEETEASSDEAGGFQRLEAELEEAVGAPIRIKSSDRRSGRIEIHFNDPDEFERLRRLLRSAPGG